MGDEIQYTEKELAVITLQTKFRTMALEVVMTEMVASLPKVLSGIGELTPQKADILAKKIHELAPKLIQDSMLKFIANDEKVSKALGEDILKAFEGIKFEE